MNKKNNISSWILLSLSLIIISVILWNTFLFFQKFKTEERSKMQIWSLAQAELTKSLDDDNISNLTLEVLKNNSTTPMIKVNKNGEIEFNNIANLKIDDSTKINKLIRKTPIEVHKATFFILFREFSSYLTKRITKAPKRGRNIVNDSSGISVI